MTNKSGRLIKLASKKGLLSIGLIIILLSILIWGIVYSISGGMHSGTTSRTSPTAGPYSTPVSPLLFGTNMSLFDSNDQMLTSSTTRTQLQQLHARIIRMPIRSSLSESTEIAAAQVIKSLGALPLIVLRGAVDANVLADDTRIVHDMNRIFGNSVVYYEYGNEEDLQGVDATGYTNSWNAIVPQLKRIALQGQFIGPVNFQYDRSYLTTFLLHANPRPDEVSWHEYTCDDSWSNEICISHLANWTRHISDARANMTATLGTALPIMITEWNYAPNAVPNDGKNNDPTFMSSWTSKALQTLAANRIFAAMQYACTNTSIAMITTNGTPTAQGMAFQNIYQQMLVGGKLPAPAPTAVSGPPQASGGSPSSTATGTANSYGSFSFEDGGTDGWSGHGNQSTLVQNSITVARDGKHALQISLANLGPGDFPYVSVGRSNLAVSPNASQVISMYVYLPANATNLDAKVFVMDSQYHWFSPDSWTLLQSGTWNHMTFTVPLAANGQLRQLGIQFNNPGTTVISTRLFIDAVSWN